MINKYLPNIEELTPIADNIRAVLKLTKITNHAKKFF